MTRFGVRPCHPLTCMHVCLIHTQGLCWRARVSFRRSLRLLGIRTRCWSLTTLVKLSTTRSSSRAWYVSRAYRATHPLSLLQKPPRAPETSNEAAITDQQNTLFSAIANQFGSLEQFKSNFSAAALGMFSSGWLYCVVDNVGELAIYPIFGSGTLLVRSGSPAFPNQRVVGEIFAQKLPSSPSRSSPAPTDHAQPPLASSPVSGGLQSPLSTSPPPHARTFSTSSLARSEFSRGSTIDTASFFGEHGEILPPGSGNGSRFEKVGQVLNPLFCVSLHEHAWLPAYGVWGKEEYMKRFWSVLDWEKVVDRWDRFTPPERRQARA